GKGTEITTLPGAANLDSVKDLEYFQRKLYRSLNVPYSRNQGEQKSFNIGRSTEITRDEVKFSKFINRLRNKFSELFYS
ncbi:portal protein, partial [Escherichia coli]|uniref:portal protein n=1 Tax=Escherichia coli TaxID=562 RepID=UPI0021F2959E